MKVKFLQIIIVIVCMIGSGWLGAQDIHFSQYERSPLTLNPALTGAYEGTFRVGVIYRDQWASVLNNQYNTPSIYADIPVVRGFGKHDWFGAGAVLVSDQAGGAQLNTFSGALSLAYHLGIGKKANTVVSLGWQGGIVQRRVNQDELLFEDQIIFGTNSSLEYGTNEFDPSVSYYDFGVGGLVNSYLTSKFNFYIGAGVFHINNPDNGFLSEQALKSRLMVHLGANYDIADRLVLSPTMIFQTQAKAREIITEVNLGYHINPERNVTLNAGLGYRYSGALIAMIGLDYKGAKLGIAYDIDTSPLNPASRGRGAYELALSYTAKIYKTPVVKPVLFCPRF